jgi:hypothetical protein
MMLRSELRFGESLPERAPLERGVDPGPDLRLSLES